MTRCIVSWKYFVCAFCFAWVTSTHAKHHTVSLHDMNHSRDYWHIHQYQTSSGMHATALASYQGHWQIITWMWIVICYVITVILLPIQSIWITKNQPYVTTSCLQVWCANIDWPWCLEIKFSSYGVRRIWWGPLPWCGMTSPPSMCDIQCMIWVPALSVVSVRDSGPLWDVAWSKLPWHYCNTWPEALGAPPGTRNLWAPTLCEILDVWGREIIA